MLERSARTGSSFGAATRYSCLLLFRTVASAPGGIPMDEKLTAGCPVRFDLDQSTWNKWGLESALTSATNSGSQKLPRSI